MFWGSRLRDGCLAKVEKTHFAAVIYRATNDSIVLNVTGRQSALRRTVQHLSGIPRFRHERGFGRQSSHQRGNVILDKKE